jgi:hypothetical protein
MPVVSCQPSQIRGANILEFIGNARKSDHPPAGNWLFPKEVNLKIRSIIFDILVGVPGGLLIFMGMLMFNTLLSLIFKTSPITMLIILACTSLVVGMLARLIRPIHGFGTAIAAGIIAGLLILYLRQMSVAGTDMALVFGPAGILTPVVLSPLGAWVFPKFRKQPLTGDAVSKTTSNE